MDSYTSFAQVYDTFMDNIPYKEGCAYLCRLLAEYGITDGLLAELGCGTGTLTELLSECGFDMIGIDNSPDMLEIAMDKRAESGHDILYLLQDMREFELYGTVRGIISFCDSINYITDPRELLTVFRLVNNYLDPDGIFIFDFHTLHYYKDILGESTIAEDREDMSFIWDNYYDTESRIHEFGLSIFVQETDDLYRKITTSVLILWKKSRNCLHRQVLFSWMHMTSYPSVIRTRTVPASMSLHGNAENLRRDLSILTDFN